MVEFGLHMRTAAEQGQLLLPDLPHAELLAEQQHGLLRRLGQRHLPEFAQRMLWRHHQL